MLQANSKQNSIKTEMFEKIQDYSEYSTIAGLIYIFMEDQKRIGRLFWSLVVMVLVLLGIYW